MKNKDWHSRLQKDEPKKSGVYLCTCIAKAAFEEFYQKYLQLMEYDIETNQWHDIGYKNKLSHVILAWKEEHACSDCCENYEYIDLMRKIV